MPRGVNFYYFFLQLFYFTPFSAPLSQQFERNSYQQPNPPATSRI